MKSQIVIDNSSELYQFCHSQALSGELAWNCYNEKLCGRPLGLRVITILNSSLLFILDAYYGMFQYNISSQSVIHLFNSSTPPFDSPSSTNSSLDSKPLFFNDFDLQVTQQEKNENNFRIKFFLTDSSYRYMRCQNRQLIIEGSPTGRLFLYDTFTPFKLQLLVSDLHFPNGVQLLDDHNTLLIAESCRFRLIQIDTTRLLTYLHLKQEISHSLPSLISNSSSSSVKIYLSSLPGFIDNIRSIPSNQLPPPLSNLSPSSSISFPQYLTISLGTLACKPFSLLHTIYRSIWLRKVIGSIIPMRYLEYLVPSYGLVGILNVNTGAIDYSYHDPSGQTPLISQASIHPLTGDMWLGSHSNKFLGLKKWKKS